jgi:UDP-N-acetylglucosamine diphosphorylase/glucosamine-1-phosphate N-acetyltransferase
MENKLIIFEDDGFENLYPLTHLRPAYLLRPGIRTLSEILIDAFPEYQPDLICRPEISALLSESTKLPVNRVDEKKYDEVIFINGRLRIDGDFIKALKSADGNAFIMSEKRLAAIKIVGGLAADEFSDLNAGELGLLSRKLQIRSETLELNLKLYNYLWDFVNAIDDSVKNDFAFLNKQTSVAIAELRSLLAGKTTCDKYPGVHFLNPEYIYVAPTARLLPDVVLDAEKGPIFIGSDVRVEPQTYIIGPTYIGKGTHVVGGKISACSIGPVCRIGGELEETIIQGFTNKYHAGFIGHSYIGEWVNLGAMTTNSDLKNNYGSVRVSINGGEINSGHLKVGSFIGDFTRTAIGTLLNTGINIGVCCNIIADALVAEKELPSFTWFSSRHKMPYNPEKAIEAISRAMSRRDKKLSPALRQRLLELGGYRAELKIE